MTHSPGEAPEPLTKEERERILAAYSPAAGFDWPDAKLVRRYEATIRELESRRSSPESAATAETTAPIADALKRVERVLSLTDPDDESYHLGIARSQLREVRSSLRELLASSASVVSPEIRDADRPDAVDFIEKEQLAIAPQVGGGWVITTSEPTGGGDYEIRELARTREGLGVALRLAEDVLRPPSAPNTAPMNDAEYRASEGRFSAPSAPEGT